RRWILGRHARDGGDGDFGRGVFRAGQFCDAAGGGRSARTAGVLDSASGRLGGVEHRLSRRRPVQSLCRPGASDLRRRAAGLSRWPSRNARRGTALSIALFGSVFYLLGAALLYGAYGTLDIVLLAARIHAEPAVWVAVGLMTAGLQRLPSSRCICGCHQPTPTLPPPAAPCSLRWS